MDKKKIWVVLGTAVLAVGLILLCIYGASFMGSGSTAYYTQIDNTKVKEIPPHGAMTEAYTLTAYNEAGAAKELTFETSRVLTDAAYLCLTVSPLRGVVSWEEVAPGALPAAVAAKYA